MHSRTGLHVRTFIPGEDAELPAVLLVHGFGSDGRRDWVDTGIAEALAGTGRVVLVPDLPGHGESPAPSTPGEAGAPTLAAALATVVDEAGAKGFDAVGYSLGARLVWALPEAAPGRVGRTVLGGLSPAEPFEAVDVPALHRAVTEGAEPADPFTAAIAGMVRAHGDRAAGLARCVEGLRATPFAPRSWTGATPPVLVVGEDDVMTRGIERVAGLVDGAELRTVPGDHHGALTGAAFRRTVLDVLAG
ncbi:alpha/beta hydrolase [Streptomyces chumphonensis]|uniref:Alpha/beta fold hydrolase n=1 Tax=Streptomyces chumphonensis TaxID=1214925 RepID=A0A927F265_9ACTN|nr:alpha/beta hydrolase [Streptomyces chumphonensis]MBD3933833.1 alpha/beta fold hydrolase [Streptomyces chumphonensis]